MKDYASLKKKNTASRTIAIIMAVLLVIEMCSLTMLFSRVVGFTNNDDGYVLSLTKGGEKGIFEKKDLASTAFIVPTYVADPDIYFIEPEDKINMMDLGFDVLENGTRSLLTTNTIEGEVFHLEYDQDQEVLTVKSDGTFGRENAKVIAPGTSENYKFTVKNEDKFDLKYLVYLEAWIDAKDAEGNDLWIPLNSKFYNSTDGTYFGHPGTDDGEWHDYDHIDKTGEIRPIAKGSSCEYHVEWEWPFERFDGEGLDANDAYDTMLGDLAAEGADLRAYIRIKTVAWIEDYWYIYTDVIEGKGTTTEDPDMVVQYEDEKATITATPAEGYEFIGWEFDDDDIFTIVGDGQLTDPILTIIPGSDIHAHAKFRPIPTVPPETEEPTEPPVEPTEEPTEPPVEPTEEPTEPPVEPTEEPTQPPVEPTEEPTEPPVEPTEEPTEPPIEPTEEPTEPPVPQYWIVDADVIEGEGTATPPTTDPVKVLQGSGDTVTLVATPAEGYEFIGWDIDGDFTRPEGGSLTDPTLVIQPNSDVHAHAKFRKIPKYWIVDTDVIEGEGLTAPTKESPAKVLQGSDDTVSLLAKPAEGWEFVEWVIDDDCIYEIIGGGSLTDPLLVIKPGSDVHAHAKFRQKPVPTEPEPTAEPTEPPIEPTVEPTEPPVEPTVQPTEPPVEPTVEPTEPPVEPTEPPIEPTVEPTEPPVLYWIVDADVIEGDGTTDPTVDNPVTVVQGSDDTVTITATPADGYEFIGWEVDGDYTLPEGGSLTDPTLVIKPGSDVHAHAKFKKIPKYWIVDADVIEGEGTTNPTVDNPVSVEQGSGDTVSITATPADGYEFIGWEIDGDYTLPEGGSLTDPNLIIKPNSDIHAHAKFRKVTPEPEYWIVDADVKEGEGTVSPTVDNPVKVIQNNDETVTIHAEPADGYEFIGWEIDGTYTLPEGGSLTDPTLVIKPGSDVHAHAIFRKKVVPTEEPTAEPPVEPTGVTPTSASPTSVSTTAVTPTTAPVTPQTGDFTQNLLWIALAIAAFVALIVLFFVYRKVKKREKADS